MNNFRVLLLIVLVSLTASPVFAQNKKFDKSLKKIDGYYASGELEKASSSLKKLKSSVSSKMGPSNPYMPGLLMREARINLTMGTLPEFDKALESALTESKNTFGETSNSYATSLLQVAEMYNEYGNFRIAREYVEKSRSILSKTAEIDEPTRAKIALIEAEAMIGQGFCNDAIDILNQWEKYYLQRAVEKETRVENNEIKNIRVPEQEMFERFNSYARLKTLLGNAYAQKGRISIIGSNEENPDVELVFSGLEKWVKGKTRFFGETSLADVQYRYYHAKALSENGARTIVDKDLEFSEILSDLKKKTSPTNALAHDVYLSYLSYLLRKDYYAKYLNTRLEYEKVIERSYPRSSIHRINLKAVEFNAKIAKDKTKDLENTAIGVITSKSLPKNHKTTILVLNFLYDISIAEKKYGNAENYLTQIVDTQKELCGEDSPEYHLARLSLANFMLDYTNKIDEAGKVYEISYYKHVKPQIGEQHKQLLTILNHIALWNELTDNYAAATKTLKEAKDAVNIKYDKDDIFLAQELDQIADLQLKLGEYDQAEANIKEALRVIGLKDNREDRDNVPIHISILETQAKLFAIKGMFDEAEESLDDSNDIIRKESKNNLDAHSTNKELAPLFIMLGEFSSADKLLIEQIPAYERLYGPNSIRLIEPLLNKSKVLLANGDYTEAERIAQRARQIAVKTYTESSTKTAPAQKMLADIFYTLGDYDKAEEQVNKALANR
jgi:hypothetical protein